MISPELKRHPTPFPGLLFRAFAPGLELPSVTLTSQFDAQGNRERLAAEVAGVNDLVNEYAYDNRNRMQYVVQMSQAGGRDVAAKAAVFEYDRSG